MIDTDGQQIEDILLSLQQKFLTATLSNSWSSFDSELARCQQIQSRGNLHDDTSKMIASALDNIKAMSEGFTKLQNATASFSTNVLSDFETELQNTDEAAPAQPLDALRSLKPSLQSHRHPKSSPISASSLNTVSGTDIESASDPHPLPEFIEHAYKYFVANIHNPYPSREEKQFIVDMSSSSRVTLTSVSNWFTNARRRCGWAEILKSRCKGNREEMIDISKRIFVKEDPNRPVDSQIIAEFMEMKKNVETMYEKKTRTSAWIGDLDQLISAISSEKHSEGKLKNRQAKNAIQASKTPRRIQQDRESQSSLSRTPSLSSFTSSGSTIEDDDYTHESTLVFDGKRKSSFEDHNLFHLRGSSPASSLSSFSFTSEFSDNRVPSLSWSDSGDEERPRKRLRSNAVTPASSSPILSEMSFPLGDSFKLSPSSPASSFIPARGQKRSYDTSFDFDITPTAKRIRSDFTQNTDTSSPRAGLPSDVMLSSVSTPTSNDRRSSFSVVDFDSLLTLGTEEPQPVEITPPDTSIPLEVGVFDWSNPLDSFGFAGGPTMDVDLAANSEIASTDFSQLYHMFAGAGVEPEMATALTDKTDVDAGIESPISDSPPLIDQLPFASEQSLSLSLQDIQVDLSSFDLTRLFPENDPQSSPSDPSGLTSHPVSVQTFDRYPVQAVASTQTPAKHPNAPLATSTSVPATPETQGFLPTDSSASIIDLTGQDLTLVEKALRKEYKRRELEEKKAALERELEELERE